jgi:quercetin dioxygenase-like cupin family protein
MQAIEQVYFLRSLQPSQAACIPLQRAENQRIEPYQVFCSVLLTHFFMAHIMLHPGERFDHSHQGTSTTWLVKGAVELEVNGQIQRLTKGNVIEIPAHAMHCVTNVGRGQAVVGCAH